MSCVIRSETTRRTTVTLLRVLAVAAVYYGSGRLGLLSRVTVRGATVTPLWPPTGIALGSLLLWGTRMWPGIALGALLVITATGDVFDRGDLTIIAGNTLAPVLAFVMLRRVGFRTDLAHLRDGTVLVFVGALGGMLISATTGTTVLLFEDKLPEGGYWPVWFAWWVGDAMGVLVVTPLLLVLRRVRWPRASDRWAEAIALTLAVAVVAPLATRSHLTLLFTVFPLLIWAALRFQLAGSAPSALLVTVLAVVSATHRLGPFDNLTLFEAMINVAVLNGSVALTSLLLAAVVTEQRNIRLRIERACEELADVVDHLAPGKSAQTWLPPEDGSRWGL